LMAVCSSMIERNTPRRRRRRVSAEKKVSTAFSHRWPGGHRSDLRRRRRQEAAEGGVRRCVSGGEKIPH
jgi:hypothetical protein